MGDLGGGLVELFGVEAEEAARGAVGVAGAGGLVAEDGDADAAVEDAQGEAGARGVVEEGGGGLDEGDRLVGGAVREEEVAAVEIGAQVGEGGRR